MSNNLTKEEALRANLYNYVIENKVRVARHFHK